MVPAEEFSTEIDANNPRSVDNNSLKKEDPGTSNRKASRRRKNNGRNRSKTEEDVASGKDPNDQSKINSAPNPAVNKKTNIRTRYPRNRKSKDKKPQADSQTEASLTESTIKSKDNSMSKSRKGRRRGRTGQSGGAKSATSEVETALLEDTDPVSMDDKGTNAETPGASTGFSKKVRKQQRRRKVNAVVSAKNSKAATANHADKGEESKLATKSAAPSRVNSSEDPASTLVRPDLRIQLASASSPTYPRPLKHDDVVLVPEFMGVEGDRSIYETLSKEMRDRENAENKTSPKESPVFKRVVTRVCEYFHIDPETTFTRLNWLQDTSDWESLRHSAAALNNARAKAQNITVGVSFGDCRELALVRADVDDEEKACKVYVPQPNNACFTIGRDVNIRFKHGINALTEEEQGEDGRGGRICIMVWGWANDTVDEKGSPAIIGKQKVQKREQQEVSQQQRKLREKKVAPTSQGNVDEVATEPGTKAVAPARGAIVDVPTEAQESMAKFEHRPPSDDGDSRDEGILEV